MRLRDTEGQRLYQGMSFLFRGYLEARSLREGVSPMNYQPVDRETHKQGVDPNHRFVEHNLVLSVVDFGVPFGFLNAIVYHLTVLAEYPAREWNTFEEFE